MNDFFSDETDVSTGYVSVDMDDRLHAYEKMFGSWWKERGKVLYKPDYINADFGKKKISISYLQKHSANLIETRVEPESCVYLELVRMLKECGGDDNSGLREILTWVKTLLDHFHMEIKDFKER